MIIEYSPKFARMHRKLSKEMKEYSERQVSILKKNPFDSRLKTHKLSGKFENYFAFSIGFKYRIIFSFETKKIIRLHAIGDHDIYK